MDDILEIIISAIFEYHISAYQTFQTLYYTRFFPELEMKLVCIIKTRLCYDDYLTVFCEC